MGNSLIAFSAFVTVMILIDGKVLIVPDQQIEDCPVENQLKFIDFSNFELLPVNDTHTYFNGTFKFPYVLYSPWEASIVTEKYTQGQWLVQAISRKYADVCLSLQNPLEPFYEITKNLPPCPLEPNSEWKFDMVPIVFSQAMLNSIPAYYMGRWRGIFIGSQTVDGKKIKDCKKSYADIYED